MSYSQHELNTAMRQFQPTPEQQAWLNAAAQQAAPRPVDPALYRNAYVPPAISFSRGCVTASRFNGAEDLIEELAHVLGLKLEMSVKRGWLWFRIAYVVTGKRENVESFDRVLTASIAAHKAK